ncbi:510-methylenetetrahydromethanopterin reductase protein [Marine Group I thaumarchaeote SCGC AAA799-B03]|uniref:510-methylenetetrahydromethanopterin reductase protein n=3 Tax=Marine Group I TaxID=905826 RepID=A0A087S8H4_9ARCH|nr:510-methylenetetrahydromethanopterin reductase protein [Marine Group I thaumarchaeote SCGC AAA799-N04]KFM18054.1 510-methylenetetrahydromethanopterin reductase protein [Marine Group I thaumarchaeote SCGC RSA3]KFM22028.1 510-methylenetetrahydromethanopterin reductase protein [Marine Group I thaumarchaeote SCGC AAA799-B03]
MRIACSLGSMLSVNEVLNCAEKISKTQTDTIWVPETWGMESFSMLSAVSSRTSTQNIGSSIINIYSRSPAAIAMGAVTVDTISNGRVILGLGTSSLPIVETFHGYKFEKPLQRMEEYVEIIKLITSGKPINYSGKFFNLKNFTLLIKPQRESIPIYIAAVNQKMVELTWRVGDGVIFYLRPKNEMRETIQKMQSQRKIDVTCQIITCVSENSDEAIERVKKTLAFYISVGKIYREFLAKNGFENETANIFEEFKKSGFKSNHELVSDSMLKELTICGTPEECKKQLDVFMQTGIDLPIIQFNPVGDTMTSFEVLQKTFLD